MAVERLLIVGPGGRLEVELAGPADGEALIFHMGTPSTVGTYAPLVELGAERDLRHVAYARPGYAGSDRRAGRSVADCVSDVAAIADALGIERFFTVGRSGGGAACAGVRGVAPGASDRSSDDRLRRAAVRRGARLA